MQGSEVFITSKKDHRSYRAVSAPMPGISRESALGSHSPYTVPKLQDAGNCLETAYVEHLPRLRRATLPSIVLDGAERDALRAAIGQSEYEGDIIQDDEKYFGFAVTSGSNPKRRSKSADDLYDASRAHRMSPIQWRQWRRRSDEIQYWRDSAGADQALGQSDPDTKGSRQQIEPEVLQAATIDKTIPANDTGSLQGERNTFDFGLVATTIRDQECAGLEQRVVTVEIKLMDLEYAISKLQARTLSPTDHSPKALRPILQPPDQSEQSDSPPSPLHYQPSVCCGVEPQTIDNSFLTESLSTKPTSLPSLEHKYSDTAYRPVSNATTVRPRKISPSQTPPSPQAPSLPGSAKRDSLTSITIDHYTTLINLLRREQAARKSLEERVDDLQRQITDLKSPPPRNLRHRHWQSISIQNQRSDEFIHYPIRSRSSETDETDTEDGDQEVWETPTEQQEFDHRHFERMNYAGLLEGEAF